MFGREHRRAEAPVARGADPLPRVEPFGSEDRRILPAISPLAIGEGVDAKVQEQRKLVLLPCELCG